MMSTACMPTCITKFIVKYNFVAIRLKTDIFPVLELNNCDYENFMSLQLQYQQRKYKLVNSRDILILPRTMYQVLNQQTIGNEYVYFSEEYQSY